MGPTWRKMGWGLMSRSHLEGGVLVLRAMWCYVQERPEGCLGIIDLHSLRALVRLVRVCACALDGHNFAACRLGCARCGLSAGLGHLQGPSAGLRPFCKVVALLQGGGGFTGPFPTLSTYPSGPGQHVRYMANAFVSISEHW